jgi:hypothetical protein
MISEAQSAANRRNARKSTGPRTAAGKAKSSMNALKGGLSSPVCAKLLLPTEFPAVFEAFRDAFLETLNPVGAVEEQLATEVIELSWRLGRVANIERGILANSIADAEERFLTGYRRMLEVTRAEAMRTAVGIRDPEEVVKITDKELHEHVVNRILGVGEFQDTEEARLARGFIEDAAGPNAMAKVVSWGSVVL